MIYVISTFPPKKCGIAVFSQNFVGSFAKQLNKKAEIGVMAVEDEKDDFEYGKDVVYRIQKNQQKSYFNAADFINVNKPQACVIEHEFGIYGGEHGSFILSLINRIKVPVVVVLHTILQDPNPKQLLIIQEFARRSNKIVVMSTIGADYLKTIYGVNTGQIAYIPHGVPSFKLLSKKELLKKFNWKDRKVLVTFGLLSRNKGIETAIQAMKGIIKEIPNALYLIIGKTHPEVVRQEGEEYRNYLNDMVEQEGLKEHVVFVNSFLEESQIIEYVTAADLYVTPYQDPNQITSGTLSYAIGSGTPFVSTPYRYAEEKANDGCGRLFGFKDYEGMAQVVIEVFSNSGKLQKMEKQCISTVKSMSWGNVALSYIKLFDSLAGEETPAQKVVEPSFRINLSWLPIFNLNHVYNLTDSTGMIQHARFAIPRYEDGYCVDDNVRALMLMVMAYRINRDYNYLPYINRYLAFTNYMINPDGSIRNFLGFDRSYLDKVGSADCYGRTLWALAYLIRHAPMNHLREVAKELWNDLRKYLPSFIAANSVRGIANAIIGVSYYVSVHQDDEEMKGYLVSMADNLVSEYKSNSRADWKWFEKSMTYDNAILPLAMLRVYEYTQNQEYLNIGIEATQFLDQKMKRGQVYCPIGNEDWYRHDMKAPSVFDQQPIEIMAFTWLNYQAFRVTKDISYIKKLQQSFRWFLGDNEQGKSLYDYETKGCYDGLGKDGTNKNQGAESTLAFWISHCLVYFAVELEYQYVQ